jgi:hypothetical protein
MFHKHTVSRAVAKVLMEYKLPESTNHSLTELLNLPISELNNYIEIAREIMEDENKKDAKELDKMKNKK